ncbi:PilW family protein [Stutzerimonas tarimensis]|uniref:PilW family protein n=1 Tax=Stutzerimonas tarimensis TaxID=1507735 RepID=A0ABV7TAU5_9GAMM
MKQAVYKQGAGGFGLVELMIALVIGLLLSAVAIQVFLSSKNTYRLQDSIARLQENGRFAIHYLSTDIRMAGYMGCGRIDSSSVNIVADDFSQSEFNNQTLVSGAENVAAGNAWGAAPGTDVIVIRRGSPASARLAGNLANSNANIQLHDNSLGIIPNDVLFLSDCVSTDIFRATNVSQGGGKVAIAHAQGVNSSPHLSKAYGMDAELMMFERVSFFVRETNGRRALFVHRQIGERTGSAAAVPVELVDGVEDMQLEYGVDNTANNLADVYVTASSIADWSSVVSVRLNLLLHGSDATATSGPGMTQAITFNDAAAASDGRLRQAFSTVIALRNRLP